MPLLLSYNVRNVLVRKLSTLLTFAVVSVVVFLLCVLLSFAAGIAASLRASGSPLNIIVLAKGATAESTSIIFPDEATQFRATPGLAQNDRGAPLISQSFCVQTTLPRKGSSRRVANVAVRGVDDAAFEVHADVRIVEGRRFRNGALEVVVGRAARRRFADLDIGGTLALGRLGSRTFKVVGVFESGGSALESEIWGPLGGLTDAYGMRLLCSALIRVTDEQAIEPALEYLTGPTVSLQAKPEPKYYEELATKNREIVQLTTILITLMAVGAAFAVANTMYTTVDARRREIAMLKTLGFSRAAVLLTFLVESALLCLAGCLVGLLGSAMLNGRQQDFLSDTTWTVLAYELRITPGIILAALSLALTVGVFGALAPAIRAARTPIIEALRKV